MRVHKEAQKNFQMTKKEESKFSKETKRGLTSLHCCREHNRERSASVAFPHPSAILKKSQDSQPKYIMAKNINKIRMLIKLYQAVGKTSLAGAAEAPTL